MTLICAGDGAYAMPSIPQSLMTRKAASLVRIDVLASALRIAIIAGRMRR